MFYVYSKRVIIARPYLAAEEEEERENIKKSVKKRAKKGMAMETTDH